MYYNRQIDKKQTKLLSEESLYRGHSEQSYNHYYGNNNKDTLSSYCTMIIIVTINTTNMMIQVITLIIIILLAKHENDVSHIPVEQMKASSFQKIDPTNI